MEWIFEFKLHLAFNDQGDLLTCCLTPGNIDDRTPVPQLGKRLRGKVFGKRGYISTPLTHLLFEQGSHLITRLRKNMNNHLMHFSELFALAHPSWEFVFQPSRATYLNLIEPWWK